MGDRTRFCSLLVQVSRAVVRRQREQVCCGDLTFQQFETLRRIQDNPEASLGSIADDLGIEQSTASRNLARLERDRYVTKARDAEDARSITVALTARGRSALATMSCDERDALSKVYARVRPADRPVALVALGILAEALQTDDRKAPCCEAAGDEPLPGRAAS